MYREGFRWCESIELARKAELIVLIGGVRRPDQRLGYSGRRTVQRITFSRNVYAWSSR